MKKLLFVVALASISLVSCENDSDYLIIQNKGSDTLVNLAQAWAEEYRKLKPDVAVAVSGGGSGTGIAALINGTVDIANSSRRIKEEEREEARKNNGKDVNEFVVGMDALAVFVHPNNPITGLTLEEVACIYGEGGTCEYWHQVRNTQVPGCQGNKIIRISRQSNSGTYQYFREAILGKKHDLKLGSMDLNGSKEAIDLVEKTPCAIGYTGMGYLNPHVRALCLSKNANEPCIEPNIKNAVSKVYPIARELYMYTSGAPSEAIQDYINWTQSDRASEITLETGYTPAEKVKL
ncbi:MAG: phosphate ABC transporter substrate-binding protein [Bacteriovoracaceae bacterium]|nr:phosphate ABC transporter substrate-binding protein [Bacteriovoracaceae bacterium]